MHTHSPVEKIKKYEWETKCTEDFGKHSESDSLTITVSPEQQQHDCGRFTQTFTVILRLVRKKSISYKYPPVCIHRVG